MDKIEYPKYIDGVRVKECVGCGFCCIQTRCSTSLRIWPYTKGNECPGLVWKDTRYICKLAAMDGPKGSEYRVELYVGAGCCSNLNTWRRDVKPRRERDIEPPKFVKYTMDKVFAAFLQSMGGQFVSSDLFFLTCFGMAHRLEQQGMSVDEIESIIKEIRYQFSENRPKYQADFMG